MSAVSEPHRLTIESSTDAHDPARGPWRFDFRDAASEARAEEVWRDLAPTPGQYTGQFQAFVDALPEAELPVTLDDAQATLELVTAWYRSASTGSTETLPLADDAPWRGSWMPR